MKWLRATLLLLNLLCIAFLFLCTLSTTTPPETFGIFSFIGLLFPILLLLNLIFVLIWIALLDWFVVLPLFAIALCWTTLQNTFNIPKKSSQEKGLRLMSWNIKNFDLYNWTKNADTRSKMMAEIERINPDVICFQEFYSDNGVLFDNISYMRDTLGYRYHDFLITARVNKPLKKYRTTIHQRWGIAIFSKYPLKKKGHLQFKNSRHNSCMFAEVQFKEQLIRVYNIHLQSIQLGYDDYFTIEQMEKKHDTNWSSIKPIIKKLLIAFGKRSDQAREVSDWMKNHPGSKIICGDFNDTPASYTYTTISEGLYDPFLDYGKGFGNTYTGLFSFFRIDYILFQPNIQVNSYEVIRKELSDHYPVVSTFSIH